MAVIRGRNEREYAIGNTITKDGTLRFDLFDNRNTEKAIGNIPIAELIEHLNTLEGVRATYTPPVKLPQGIGAIVGSPRVSTIRLVRVTTGPGKNWVQNSRGYVDADTSAAAWYTDAQVSALIHASDYVILSEGVTE